MEKALFPIQTETALSAYLKSISELIPEDFASTTGLPAREIPEDACELPGLIIVSNFSAGGYNFRTQEKSLEYHTKVSNNQRLMLEGKMKEVKFFDWKDPEYTLEELAALLIRLKNVVYEAEGDKIYYIQIFVEIDTAKNKVMEFLGMLEKLNIAYLETY